MAGITVSFRTSAAAIGAPPSPSDAATAVTLINQLLEKNRPGDALMVLTGLPAEVRHRPELASLEAEIRSAIRATKAP
jgi:hypothetical protein